MNIRQVSSIHEIDAAIWDELSAGRPFQSHRWYAFGERVMADCQPLYLLAEEQGQLIARACLWRVPNEPLPLQLPAFLQSWIAGLLRRWPPLICRSPLANAGGLLLRQDARRGVALAALAEAALTAARQQRASILLFDFLAESENQGWPTGFVTGRLPSPGTVLENRWQSLDDYLAAGDKKDRQHYKRSLRKAAELGIGLVRLRTVPDLEAALRLIRSVERRYGSMPNPWVPELLRSLELVDGIWLEARREGRLVGCGLILEDNQAQLTTALGLEEQTPYAYFLLIYASLQEAFEKKVRLLRWGSGAYEVKERLGFRREPDNFVKVHGTNGLTQWIAKLATI